MSIEIQRSSAESLGLVVKYSSICQHVANGEADNKSLKVHV